MPHTQWRPSPVSVLRDPTTLLRHFGDHASEDPVRASNLSMGLPTPIWPAKRDLSPSERSQRAAQRQGVQVHAAIGAIARNAQGADLDTIDSLVTDALNTVVTGRENGNLRRARARVAGLVHQFVRVFLPPLGVEFHGAEVPVPNGRADLLWWHPEHGWFFDEVKTFQFAGADELHDYQDQVIKYLTAGETLGGDFAGVRLITLGNTNASRLYTPDGLIAPLFGTDLSPQRLTALPGTEEDVA